jgi:hypothetical protein
MLNVAVGIIKRRSMETEYNLLILVFQNENFGML